MTVLFNTLVRNQLVYTVSWEDWELDQIALKLAPDDRVVMITGGGCNVLNYYLAGVRHIDAVDLNPCQSALLELKLAAAASLDFADFFKLFGDGLHTGFRELYRNTLRPNLSSPAQQFWDCRQSYFNLGIWRQRFHQRSTSGLAYRILLEWRRLWPKLGRELDALYVCETIEEQAAAYSALNLRQRLDSPLFRWMLRRRTLMDLMAIPGEQFDQIEKRYPAGMPGFALNCMENVFTRTLLKQNYFWQAAWFGRFTRICCPPYLKEENFPRLVEIGESVSVHTMNLAAFLAKADKEFDKIVLLDHMDWLGQSHRNELIREWEGILRTASARARIIFRTGGPDASYLEDLPITLHGHPAILHDLIKFDYPLASELHKRDRVSIYGNFYICEPAGIERIQR